jgi:nucleotide-binding universal stress UspA family protein
LDDLRGAVVAGAYGHSRFRELILGGVTRHLIAQSTRYVLLSH